MTHIKSARLPVFMLLMVASLSGRGANPADGKTSPPTQAAVSKAQAEQGTGDAQIRLVPAATQVSISGRPGSDASLTSRITFMADKDVPELLFRPADLKLQGGTEVISSSQLQVVSPDLVLKNIKAHTSQQIDIKVSGLKVPGIYTGSIEFLPPGHGLTPAFQFELQLTVEEIPKLSPRNGSTTIKIQLVNCLPLIGCPLNDWVYRSSRTENHSFTLDNTSMAPFKLTGAVAAYGDINHENTGGALILDLSHEFPADPIVTVPLTVKSDVLGPDHYLGDVQLRIPGKDDALKLPLELNVKSGPEVPILVLLIGILFGRFIKYMKDKGVPQSDLLRQLLQVHARATQDPQNLGLLQHMLEQVRGEIDGMELDTAKTDLALINSRLTLLSRLRYLETLLTPRSAEGAVNDILSNIKLARGQISLGTDPQATATAIETQVKALAGAAAAPDQSTRAIELAAASGVRGAASFTVAPLKDDALPKSRLRHLVSILSGHDDSLRADLTLWFLRPLAWALLILVLTVTGFLQLYTKNLSFGADLVGDYFGLLVWATGSDVASRTLTNFKGS